MKLSRFAVTTAAFNSFVSKCVDDDMLCHSARAQRQAFGDGGWGGRRVRRSGTWRMGERLPRRPAALSWSKVETTTSYSPASCLAVALLAAPCSAPAPGSPQHVRRHVFWHVCRAGAVPQAGPRGHPPKRLYMKTFQSTPIDGTAQV